MPPRVKYTREEILDAALAMTREQGIDAVMARSLGAKLGISAKPIFHAFENMDEVKSEVRRRAQEIFQEYVSDYNDYQPAFKRYGMQMVAFAKEEPKLFQLLFMQTEEQPQSFMDALFKVMGDVKDIVSKIMQDYELTEEQARRVFDQLWVHVYGIGVLCAMKICVFSEDEVSEMLSETFLGTISAVKSVKYLDYLDQAKLGIKK